ncbi:MAG: hypothetical protein LIP28_10535, partial [Deltaproteobacteria bacterium]|nr:hypothetical protein [Deltaproteobacteria bacterium]
MRIPAKKILRIAAIVLGGFLLVLCLAVAGVLIWLRTDSAERFVADFATKTLADQGLFLTLGGIDGPLPSRVLLTGVSLADAKGTWFAAREVEIALSLADLLRLTATVSLARVDSPQLYRLPVLPPSPDAAKEPEPGAPYFSLPVAVRLDKLVLENGDVFAPVVFPETAGGGNPLLRINLRGGAKASASQPLEAAVTVTASVADMKALAAGLQAGEFPLSGFDLTLDAKAAIGTMIDAAVTATATPEAWAEKLPLDFGLQARLEGSQAALRSDCVVGLGRRLAAKGSADLAPLALRADAAFRAQSGGTWETVAARLSGQDIGGNVQASVQASLDGDKTVAASVALSGADMHWGMEQVQRILGPCFTVKATAAGSEATRYTLNLETLAAGTVSASGSAAFGPRDKSISASLEAALSDLNAAAPGVSGAGRAKLDASGTLDAPSANLAIVSHSLKTDAATMDDLRATATLSGTLRAPAATVDATVASVTAESASVQNVAAKARLSGTLTAPVFSMEATGESITTQAGAFRRFRAGMDGTASLPDGADRDVTANASVTLAESPAGPVALRTDLAATQKKDGSITARLHGLDLSLAGTDLAADITAAIPPAGSGAALPAIDGTASAAIRDWKPIAALSGQPISGGRAAFDAKFSHTDGVQQLTAALKADSLTMPDVFSLAALSATLDARDLANPDIALNLAMGKGEAGPVTWRSGAAAVNARRGTGTFAAALRTDKSAGRALAAVASSTPAEPGRTERLTAAGRFSLSPMQVTLDRLAARVPDSAMGIYLATPATIALDNGVKVENLKLNVVPGKGAVALDASLDAADVNLTATVTEFPFRLIRDAAKIPVPDGNLSAEAAIKKTGASVRGTIDAKALVTAPAVGEAKTPPVAFTLASTLDQNADPNFPQLKSGGGVSRLKGSVYVGVDGQRAGGGTENTPDAQIHFNLPLRFAANGLPEAASSAPMGATVNWRGEIAPLWALAPMQDRTLSGVAQVNAEVKGSMRKPDYTVSAYVAGGRYEDSILGVLLTDIALEAGSASTGESKILLRAEDGAEGYVALEGDLSAPPASDGGIAPIPRLAARGQINHLQPLHRDDVFLRLSGRLSADGPLDALKVVADVEVERGELSIANLRGGVRTLEITDPSAKQKPTAAGPSLDLKGSVPHRFYIRG